MRSKLWFVLVLFVAVITGCKDGAKPDADASKVSTDTSSKKGPDSPQAPAFSFGDFSVVILSKTDLARLFSNNNTQKILLQFVDDNTGGVATPYTLIAYGTTKANEKTSELAQLNVSPNSTTTTISGKKYLGNLELTRKQINVLIGNNGNSPITISNAKDLIFTPTTSTQYPNYVIYKVNVPTIQKIVDDLQLNPSPPADPCSTCQ